jgi:hypothetical protein
VSDTTQGRNAALAAGLLDEDEPADPLVDDELPDALAVDDEPAEAELPDVEPEDAGEDGDELDVVEPDDEDPAGGGVEQAARTRAAPATRTGIAVVSRRDIESLLINGAVLR